MSSWAALTGVWFQDKTTSKQTKLAAVVANLASILDGFRVPTGDLIHIFASKLNFIFAVVI